MKTYFIEYQVSDDSQTIGVGSRVAQCPVLTRLVLENLKNRIIAEYPSSAKYVQVVLIQQLDE